eukprot:4748787-Pleurochrysis_carterae.AAC.1
MVMLLADAACRYPRRCLCLCSCRYSCKHWCTRRHASKTLILLNFPEAIAFDGRRRQNGRKTGAEMGLENEHED